MQILRVSMDDLSVRREEPDEEYAGSGGRGFCARVLSREVDPTCDPLGSGNKLIFANGLLAGTRTSSTGRLSVGAKSPLTLGIKESNAGGLAGDALARLGLRAIVVEGAPSPGSLHLLEVGAHSALLLPAEDLRGLGTQALTALLLERYGSRAAVICIGPAGEHRLPVAGVAVNDADGSPSRYAGRGGMGAVMGAKGLKVIVLKDETTGDVPIADSSALRVARKNYHAALRENHTTGLGFPTFGTVMSLDTVRALGGLPVHNFRSGDVDGEHPQLTAEGVRETILERGGAGTPTHACMHGCVIRCSNVFPDAEGRSIVSPLEYENLVLLGPNLGIFDLDQVAYLNHLCNDYGIDTMESGVAIGVAMEAGVAEFGDFEAAAGLLGEIAQGTVLGKVLGQGAAVTGRVFGVERIPTVKGQAISAYDPRAVKGLGVTYATSPMGADHTAGFVLYAKVDHHSAEGQVAASRASQIVRAALDALGICAFTMAALMETPTLLPDLLNAVCGTSHTPEFLSKVGREVLRLELAFNHAAGFSATDDRLPEFMRSEQLPPSGLTFDVSQGELEHIFDDLEAT